MDVGVHIRQLFLACIRGLPGAELKEVAARLGSVLCEQLNDNLLLVSVDIDVKERVVAAGRPLDQLSVGIVRSLLVDHRASGVDVAELVQNPLEEGVPVADVYVVVVVNDRTSNLVGEEGALLGDLQGIKILFPLGLEEREHFD